MAKHIAGIIAVRVVQLHLTIIVAELTTTCVCVCLRICMCVCMRVFENVIIVQDERNINREME